MPTHFCHGNISAPRFCLPRSCPSNLKVKFASSVLFFNGKHSEAEEAHEGGKNSQNTGKGTRACASKHMCSAKSSIDIHDVARRREENCSSPLDERATTTCGKFSLARLLALAFPTTTWTGSAAKCSQGKSLTRTVCTALRVEEKMIVPD
jgi:hypothetical protein